MTDVKVKVCTNCKLSMPLTSFSRNGAKKDGLQNKCKPCVKVYNQAYYPQTKDRHAPLRKQSRERIRLRNQEFVWDYLATHPCIDCGLTNPLVLEFDHLSDKFKNVSNMMSGSLTMLKTEIAKCDVRCRNCHIIKTYERSGDVWRSKFDLASVAQSAELSIFNRDVAGSIPAGGTIG